jgi:hypothetical protein
VCAVDIVPTRHAAVQSATRFKIGHVVRANPTNMTIYRAFTRSDRPMLLFETLARVSICEEPDMPLGSSAGLLLGTRAKSVIVLKTARQFAVRANAPRIPLVKPPFTSRRLGYRVLAAQTFHVSTKCKIVHESLQFQGLINRSRTSTVSLLSPTHDGEWKFDSGPTAQPDYRRAD